MGTHGSPDARRVTAVEVSVTGQVQGVAFRWHTQREAVRLGVTGWVRNEYDGSLAGHFEGDPAAVVALVQWCRGGPPSARVALLDVHEADVTGATSFEIAG